MSMDYHIQKVKRESPGLGWSSQILIDLMILSTTLFLDNHSIPHCKDSMENVNHGYRSFRMWPGCHTDSNFLISFCGAYISKHNPNLLRCFHFQNAQLTALPKLEFYERMHNVNGQSQYCLLHWPHTTLKWLWRSSFFFFFFLSFFSSDHINTSWLHSAWKTSLDFHFNLCQLAVSHTVPRHDPGGQSTPRPTPTDKETGRVTSRDTSHPTPGGLQSPEKFLEVFGQGWSQRAWELVLWDPWELPGGSLPLLQTGIAGVWGLCFLLEIRCGIDYLWPF